MQSRAAKLFLLFVSVLFCYFTISFKDEMM